VLVLSCDSKGVPLVRDDAVKVPTFFRDEGPPNEDVSQRHTIQRQIARTRLKPKKEPSGIASHVASDATASETAEVPPRGFEPLLPD